MTHFYDAFISYGRADSKAFAVALNQRLTEIGLNVWFDFENIPLGVDYQNQIDDGIEHAHNFLFVISPHSVNSPYCLKEIELAIAHKKRIIPLLHVEKISYETWQKRFPHGAENDWQTYMSKGLHDSYSNMHPTISKINWIYCREGLDDFESALTALQNIFIRQQNYVLQHTQILTRALVWQRQQRQSRYLLVGEERQQAETWLATQFSEEQAPCLPTELQCEYISESIKNANNLMTDIFLTYTEENRDMMMTLRLHLWRAGLTVWTNKTDIQSGEDFQQAIKRGIEGASNLVVLLSPEAVVSTDCQQELDYALTLHKRIIPILISPTNPTTIPTALRSLQHIDLSEPVDSPEYERNQSQLLNILHQDAAYYDTHKQLLIKALKWERQSRNPSILLRGYNLRQGESWLQLAQQRAPATRSAGLPTPLQIEFIEESLRQPPAPSLDVFLSYSRTDSGIARQINDALQMQGKTTWFDQESIAAGSADFQQEIYRGIEVSDNFVFILSPTAIASPYCTDEVNYATQLHKRIVTVLARSVDPAQLHPELAKVQWLDFTNASTDFSAPFSQFIRTLDTDREHVHSHTKWSQRALEWQESNQTEDLLLRGTELAIAHNWLQEAEIQAKRPLPTALQKTFIQASEALRDRLQQAAEVQRQKELKQAQQLAEAAEAQRQAEAEARLQAEQRAEQEAKARRISQRITLLTGIGAPLLSILVLAAGITWRASQVEEIESLVISAESHLRSQQPFDALVASARAGLRLNRLWLFPPRQLQSQIDGALRQAEQDVQERHRLEADDTVWSVALSSDERYLAIASQDGRVKLWDMTEQQEINSFQAATAPVYQVVFSADNASLITVAENQQAQQWNFAGQLLQTFGSDDVTATRVGVSTDGQWVVTGGPDGKVQLWTADGQLHRELKTAGAYIYDVNISPDNRHLVASDDEGVAHLWDLKSNAYQQLRHEGGVIAARFTPDSAVLITASNFVLHQWNLQGKELRHIPVNKQILDIDVGADGQTIAIAYVTGTLAVWDLASPSPIELLGHGDAVNQVQISADQQTLISGASDRTIRFWNLTTPQRPSITLPEDAFIKDIHLENANGYVLAHHSDGTVKLWDLKANLIATLDLDGELRGATFSPNQNLLATGTASGDVILWNLEGQRLRRFNAHGADVVGLRFSPDGKYLVTGSADQTAAMWDLQGNRQVTLEGHDNWVAHLSFSPDGQSLATSSYDRTTRLWNMDGSLRHLLQEHQDGVTASAFSPDNQYLVTLSEDRTVKIWDVATGTFIRDLQGHRGGVTDVTFVDDNHLVTSSDDGTARLWNLQGQEITQYKLYNTTIRFVRMSADGQFLATVADDGTARLWRIDTFDNLLGQVCQQIQPYLTQSTTVPNSDRRLCDRIARFL